MSEEYELHTQGAGHRPRPSHDGNNPDRNKPAQPVVSAACAPNTEESETQISAVDLETIIENSEGRWNEDEFRIRGPELIQMLRACYQLAAQPSDREQNLAMAIRRIVSSARRNCEDGSNVLNLANEAWSLLVRLGLEGSPLRDAGIVSDPAPPADEQAQPTKKLQIFRQGPWIHEPTGVRYWGTDLDASAYTAYRAQPDPAMAWDEWLGEFQRLSTALSTAYRQLGWSMNGRAPKAHTKAAGEAGRALMAHARKRVQPASGNMVDMVDAAMSEMQNLHPPMRRSECDRLIRAALKVQPASGEDARDAARYRWLRGPDHESTRYSRWRVEHWDGANGWQPVQRESMDAAIDAAIQQGKQP